VVELDSGGSPLVLRLARNGWSMSAEREAVPTAVSGGWTDADALRFDVQFLGDPAPVDGHLPPPGSHLQGTLAGDPAERFLSARPPRLTDRACLRTTL
jgi:hypothetical protein